MKTSVMSHYIYVRVVSSSHEGVIVAAMRKSRIVSPGKLPRDKMGEGGWHQNLEYAEAKSNLAGQAFITCIGITFVECELRSYSSSPCAQKHNGRGSSSPHGEFTANCLVIVKRCCPLITNDWEPMKSKMGVPLGSCFETVNKCPWISSALR